MKTVVSLDLDGCLFDFLGAIARRVARVHGFTLRPEDIRTYSLAGVMGNDAVDREIIDALNDARTYQDAELYPGVASAVRSLAADPRFEIIALTSRPRHTRQYTQLRLMSEFGHDVFSNLIVCKTDRKPAYAKRLRVKYAFEDHGPTALAYARGGAWSFLVNRPYNAMAAAHGRIKRIDHVRDGINRILGSVQSQLPVGA